MYIVVHQNTEVLPKTQDVLNVFFMLWKRHCKFSDHIRKDLSASGNSSYDINGCLFKRMHKLHSVLLTHIRLPLFHLAV